MPTDIEIIKQRQAGQAEGFGLAASPEDAIDKSLIFHVNFTKAAADGMASTTTAETFTGKTNGNVRVRLLAAYAVVTATGITADAANNATITISKRDSAAANKTSVATLITNIATGNLVIGAPKAMTITATSAAEFIIAELSGFTYEIAKGGTGVVVPPTEFTLVFTKV